MGAYSGEISVGVIGTGGMGTRHAETLSSAVSGARVAGVTDLDRSRAEKLTVSCGSDATVFQDEQSLIQDEGIDAVVLTTPDDTHARLVMECLRCRKPVFCEKPLATTVEDARGIVEAEAELGRKLVQVGFMRRYYPRHLDVKSAIDSGAIGQPSCSRVRTEMPGLVRVRARNRSWLTPPYTTWTPQDGLSVRR